MLDDGWEDYQLLDFGEGRKLERWGSVWLDRPSPAANSARCRHRDLWSQAHGRFERAAGEQGSWIWKQAVPDPWTVQLGSLVFELAPTPFGHVGLFPEQAPNWKWIQNQLGGVTRPYRILNLFAYTGASTLAAAGPQHEVVHVDASKSSVMKARRNAELSKRNGCTIRWIVEDAAKFCRREVKRGNHYDAIILDPPTYGHGPKGEPWHIDQQLPELLQLCGELWTGTGGFFLLTCHSETLDIAALRLHARGVWTRAGATQGPPSIEAGPMNVTTREQARLNSGWYARWSLETADTC